MTDRKSEITAPAKFYAGHADAPAGPAADPAREVVNIVLQFKMAKAELDEQTAAMGRRSPPALTVEPGRLH